MTVRMIQSFKLLSFFLMCPVSVLELGNRRVSGKRVGMTDFSGVELRCTSSASGNRIWVDGCSNGCSNGQKEIGQNQCSPKFDVSKF